MLQRPIKPWQRVSKPGDTRAIERARTRRGAHRDTPGTIHAPNVEVAVPAARQDSPGLQRLQLPLGTATQEDSHGRIEVAANLIRVHPVLNGDQQRARESLQSLQPPQAEIQGGLAAGNDIRQDYPVRALT